MAVGGESATKTGFGDGVIAFPLSARTSDVRRCAKDLETIHGVEATKYWREACRSIADSLLAAGCGEAEIRSQVFEFQAEVQAELMRRYAQRLDHEQAFARVHP